VKTAILVDGGFFLRRYKSLYNNDDPRAAARTMHVLCLKHLSHKKEGRERELLRILFYDCPPLRKRAHLPVSGKSIDFSKTEAFKFRTEFHKELKTLRQVALRLGQLRDGNGWTIRTDVMKLLLKREMRLEELSDEHFLYDVRQKGVDAKLGLDIADLAHKRLVDQIVLIAGDADFVPAAKLARKEGIDVILDSMWQPMSPDLLEHVDGRRSTCPKPKTKAQQDSAA
jgi:uncharacterized LabA/DUF88 family protein